MKAREAVEIVLTRVGGKGYASASISAHVFADGERKTEVWVYSDQLGENGQEGKGAYGYTFQQAIDRLFPGAPEDADDDETDNQITE